MWTKTFYNKPEAGAVYDCNENPLTPEQANINDFLSVSKEIGSFAKISEKYGT